MKTDLETIEQANDQILKDLENPDDWTAVTPRSCSSGWKHKTGYSLAPFMNSLVFINTNYDIVMGAIADSHRIRIGVKITELQKLQLQKRQASIQKDAAIHLQRVFKNRLA